MRWRHEAFSETSGRCWGRTLLQFFTHFNFKFSRLHSSHKFSTSRILYEVELIRCVRASEAANDELFREPLKWLKTTTNVESRILIAYKFHALDVLALSRLSTMEEVTLSPHFLWHFSLWPTYVNEWDFISARCCVFFFGWCELNAHSFVQCGTISESLIASDSLLTAPRIAFLCVRCREKSLKPGTE